MNQFKKGTPACGLALGTLFVLIAVLWMTIGFWKTLLLTALFALGYFLGTTENKRDLIRETANRMIPKKEAEAIDLRSELVKEQKTRMEQMNRSEKEAAEAAKATEKTSPEE